jgi:hypothetical protein
VLRKHSPRLAAVLVARAAGDCDYEIIDGILSDYRGDDSFVLRTCVDSVARLLRRDASRTKEVLGLLKHAYAMNIMTESMISTKGLDGRDMGASTAKDILRNSSEYPLALVDMAQSLLTKDAGSKAKPPGAVARVEHWFARD